MKDIAEDKGNTKPTFEAAKPSVVTLLENIQKKCDARRDKKELVRMFDPQGNKKVNREDVKEVFDLLGFKYEQNDPDKLIAMANEKKHPDHVTTAEVYKLLNRGDGIKSFEGRETTEEIASTLDKKIQEKKRENVMAILTNDIRRLHKDLENNTERGFIKPAKAKEILLKSVKRWDLADTSIVDSIVAEKTGPHGIDSQDIMAMIADNKESMRQEREKLKAKHAEIEERKQTVFETKVNDNTVKRSFHQLDEAVSKKNKMQSDLVGKFKDKGELLSAAQALSGSAEGYIKKKDIFDLYKQALNKDALTLEEKQRVFKFSENLRFREDDKKVSANDFADLVFG